ncbi:MAG: metallophosphoesterase [Candidatus Nitrosopolaris sp.]
MVLFVPRKIATVTQVNPNKNEKFYELPKPTGKPPYHLTLNSIIPNGQIKKAGCIEFHIVGDTGETKIPQAQHMVESAMEADFNKHPISFLYHVGDVVYKFGEASEYYSQFYEPYAHYPAPIFAIPGNKDGDVHTGSNVPSLTAFVNNFCATRQQVTPDALEINRDAMIQPNVYWTLDASYVTIIGLYSNVPDGGVVKEDQFQWFVKELVSASKDKALIVAIHHAPFSADDEHSGSDTILKVLDRAFEESKRLPDIIISGHVHNYQRFTRKLDKHQIPYIILGNGGHWKLHHMQQHNGVQIKTPFKLPDRDDILLEKYCDDGYGFMRLKVSAKKLEGKFYCIPHQQSVKKIDEFKLNLQKHKLV